MATKIVLAILLLLYVSMGCRPAIYGLEEPPPPPTALQGAIPRDLQAAPEQILAGQKLWGEDGYIVEGEMENHGDWDLETEFPGEGFVAAVTNLPRATDMCLEATVAGVAGSVDCDDSGICRGCQIEEASNLALAAELLAGKQLWGSSAQLVTGTMPNRGSWDLENTLPGAGYYSGFTNVPHASDIRDGAQILGVAGSYLCSGGGGGGGGGEVCVCVSGSSSNPAASGDVLAGKEAWGADGVKLAGSMENKGSWNLATSFPGAGYFSGITGPSAGDICTTRSIAGTARKCSLHCG